MTVSPGHLELPPPQFASAASPLAPSVGNVCRRSAVARTKTRSRHPVYARSPSPKGLQDFFLACSMQAPDGRSSPRAFIATPPYKGAKRPRKKFSEATHAYLISRTSATRQRGADASCTKPTPHRLPSATAPALHHHPGTDHPSPRHPGSGTRPPHRLSTPR